MGVVYRTVRRLPLHSLPLSLEEVPTVLPRFSSVPVHIPPSRPSHGPTSLYNDCKGSKADGPHKMSHISPIPGQLAYQGPVPGGDTSKYLNLGRPNTVLGWIINQEKSELKPTQVFFVRGLRIPPRFSPCKPTQERWLKLQDLILRLKSKHVLTARYLMSLIGLLASTEKMVSSQGTLEISSVVGHPPSLVRDHFSSLRVVAKLCKRDEWCRPSPQDHNIQIFTDASNEGWGAELEQVSTKALCSDREKRLHRNIIELKRYLWP